MTENKKYFETPCEGGILKLAYDTILELIRAACAEISGISEAAAPELSGENWYGNKGVWIASGESGEDCRVRVYIHILLGESITETAAAVQDRIKSALEAVTFLRITSADVFVAGIRFPKEQ